METLFSVLKGNKSLYKSLLSPEISVSVNATHSTARRTSSEHQKQWAGLGCMGQAGAAAQNLSCLLLSAGNESNESLHLGSKRTFFSSGPHVAIRGRDLNCRIFSWQLNKFILGWQSFLERLSYKELNTLGNLQCRTWRARMPKRSS